MIAYHKGEWLEDSESIDSLALTRGVAVFNTLRTLNGNIVFLHQATERLCQMAAAIDAPVVAAEIKQLLVEAAKKAYQSDREISLRIVVSPGGGQHIAVPSAQEPIVTIFTEIIPELTTPELKLMKVPYFRNAAELKHTNYLPAYMSMKEAAQKGFDNILYTDGGDDPRLIESSTNNILFVMGDQLIAPRNDIYPGLARELLLKHSDRVGLESVERDVHTSELTSDIAMFNTGVTYGPRPVVAIDSLQLDSASAHYVALRDLYGELLEENAGEA